MTVDRCRSCDAPVDWQARALAAEAERVDLAMQLLAAECDISALERMLAASPVSTALRVAGGPLVPASTKVGDEVEVGHVRWRILALRPARDIDGTEREDFFPTLMERVDEGDR